MYALEGPTGAEAVSALWEDLLTRMPNDVTAQVEAVGDVLNATTGELTGEWSHAAFTALTGTLTGGFAAPAGACIDWMTDTILDSHRVRGRTFVVPIGGEALQADGTLDPAAVTAFATAGGVAIAASAGNLIVWHRPRVASAGPPAVTARAGGVAPITACRVRDKVAVLRSRRD